MLPTLFLPALNYGLATCIRNDGAAEGPGWIALGNCRSMFACVSTVRCCSDRLPFATTGCSSTFDAIRVRLAAYRNLASRDRRNRLTVGIMAMVADEERRMISARTKAALAAAKKRGVQLGSYRGSKLTQGPASGVDHVGTSRG